MFMDSREILKFCLENGLLVDKDVLGLFSDTSDVESVKMLINRIKNETNQKILTKQAFDENKEQVNKIFLELPKEKQKDLEDLKVKLGLSIEISKEISGADLSDKKEVVIKEPELKANTDIPKRGEKVGIVSLPEIQSKKLEVKDFVTYFKKRFLKMSGVLQGHSKLGNVVSINKISGNRQGISIIGLVTDKRVTKNKNILLDVEDITGTIRVLVNQNKPELYEKAEDIPLDAVIGFRGSGNKEILFANEVIFPDSAIPERKRGDKEEWALFTGDLHVGSKLFMEENFLKFIDYLNGKVPNTPEVSKIKYLFLVGDLVAGAGIYQGQENELNIIDVEEQYNRVAEMLSMIRKDIKIIICPGNHDVMRIMEPQPVLDEKYAWRLYNLKNIVLVTNPAAVGIGQTENFSGFDVLMYHGYSFHYYANYIPKLMKEKAAHHPEKIMHYLLMNRHLAPSHSSTLYFPSEKDPFFIEKAPDIFLAGHTHKSGISYYNNILVVSSSCWESKTDFQERMGNEPDFCKVPMFNLKTRAVKILDFE
jgi:DNA polymerase II small subunit